MIPLAKRATPAAKAVLLQATALKPKRKKESDGLLPSKAHVKQNPNSDHNSGYAVDVTHDPVFGINCAEAFIKLQSDPRVKYLIFNSWIWSKENGSDVYTGINKHQHHLHISIKETCGNDTSPWFPWLGAVPKISKVKAAIKKLPKKEIK